MAVFTIMIALLLLGLILGLDSFRVSLGLGALKLRPGRQVQIALAFGLCDGIAPLIGLKVGHSLVEFIGHWANYLGALVLGVYGLYVLYMARRVEESVESRPWLVFGLPVSLSFDNFAAGVALGTLAFPSLFSAAVIGAVSGLMSLAGLRLGRLVGNYLPLKAELVGGVALILIAVAVALDMS